MRTQSEMATALIRSALTRGFSKGAAVEITKSVLTANDSPVYSWAQEQVLYDALRTACLLQPLSTVAKTLKEEDARVGGSTAANPGKGVTPVAENPGPSCFRRPRSDRGKGNAKDFHPDTLRTLAMLQD